jgi:hypothetical protein
MVDRVTMLNLKAAEKRVIESLASMWDVFDWHPLAALVTSAKTAISLIDTASGSIFSNDKQQKVFDDVYSTSDKVEFYFRPHQASSTPSIYSSAQVYDSTLFRQM